MDLFYGVKPCPYFTWVRLSFTAEVSCCCPVKFHSAPMLYIIYNLFLSIKKFSAL